MKLQEVVDNRPLVWRLAAQQLAKGKNIMYYGYLPNSSSRVIGRIEDIGDNAATVRDVINRTSPIVYFTPDDDEKLSFRPAIDTSHLDFVVVTKSTSGEDAE